MDLAWDLAGILMAGCAASFALPSAAAAAQLAAAPIQTSEQSSAIHGVVVNGKTGQPVGRVLVQVKGSSLLTGFDGKFSFSGLNGAMTMLRVKKPGFYLGLDPYQTGTKQVPVGSDDELRVMLYPEALITGTVSAANGDPSAEPLAGVQVQALRRDVDESGSRWTPGGQTMTNGDGEFRLPVAAGEYVVETQYTARRVGGRGSVMPVMVPAVGSNGGMGDGSGTSTLRLTSGTELHLELHPDVRPSHAVHVQIDSAGGPEAGQFMPQIQAHLANGLVFSPAQSRGDRQGEVVVVSVPNGSYLLSASTGLRDDAASYGETRVTVADEDVSGVTIHLQKAMELPVEVSVDPNAAAAGATGAEAGGLSAGLSNPAISPGGASFVQQLGIFLQRMNTGASLRTENVSAAARRGGPVEFSLLPGAYRLRTMGYSQWYVESATAGGTDLLTQELVVDGGSSSMPLRVVVSNQTATIKGTTKLGGQAAESYVTLIATTPSAAPVISARSAADGSFFRESIAPGSYLAVASEVRLNLDLSDPGVLKKLAPYTKKITVGAGEVESVELDAMPATEMTP